MHEVQWTGSGDPESAGGLRNANADAGAVRQVRGQRSHERSQLPSLQRQESRQRCQAAQHRSREGHERRG